MPLQIHLLGTPRVNWNGNPFELPGNRPLALLAYLIVTKKAHRREHLTNLLFDLPADPRAALRWTLARLRKEIGNEYIIAEREKISLNFQADYSLDVFDFESGKLELYQGDLLEGLYVKDAYRFEEWLVYERQRLRGLYQAGLEDQLKFHTRQDDAIAVAQTAIQLLQR